MLVELLLISSAALQVPTRRTLERTPQGLRCTRSDFLRSTAAAALAACTPHVLPAIADGADVAAASNDVVMRGVLQMTKDVESRMPGDSEAQIAIRVVGRNTKGPLATKEVKIAGQAFPIEYTITRSDLREGLADFVWLEEDIYVKGEVLTTAGKVFAEGRSKAKATNEGGSPSHQVAYLTLE